MKYDNVSNIKEVIVPEKRFEIGSCWMEGWSERNPIYWTLYDMVENENECVEIWLKTLDK